MMYRFVLTPKVVTFYFLTHLLMIDFDFLFASTSYIRHCMLLFQYMYSIDINSGLVI